MIMINRRSLLLAGLGAAGTSLLAACAGSAAGQPALVSPTGAAVAEVEKKRVGGGTERTVTLTAAAATVDLGRLPVRTWAGRSA